MMKSTGKRTDDEKQQTATSSGYARSEFSGTIGSKQKSSLFYSRFKKHGSGGGTITKTIAAKLSKKGKSKGVEEVVPYLGLNLQRTDKFYRDMRGLAADTKFLKMLASPASTFRVTWSEYLPSSAPGADGIKYSVGKFTSDGEEESVKGIEVFRARTLVESTVHELLHMLITNNSQEMNQFFSQIWRDRFLGGELLSSINGDPPVQADGDSSCPTTLLPHITVKRAVFDLSSNLASRDFVFLDNATLEKDDQLREIGVYSLQSVSLPEVPEGVRNSKCIRGHLLPGSGVVITESQEVANMREVTCILRADLGKLRTLEKMASKRKVCLKLSQLIAGMKSLSEKAIESQGSYSWYCGFSSEIKLQKVKGVEVGEHTRQCSDLTLRKAEKLMGIKLGGVKSDKTTSRDEQAQETEEQDKDYAELKIMSSDETSSVELNEVKEQENLETECPEVRGMNSVEIVSSEPAQCVSVKHDKKIPAPDVISKQVQESDHSTTGLNEPKHRSQSQYHVARPVESSSGILYKQKYEQVLLQKLKLEAEMEKLKQNQKVEASENVPKQSIGTEEHECAPSEPESTTAPPTPLTTNNETKADLDSDLRQIKQELERHKVENAQLKKKYEVIKAQTQNESLDKYNWDGELESAEKIFLGLAKKVQEQPSDMVILSDFEKFEEVLRKHPDYKKREALKIARWIEENAAKNQEALKTMRGIIPSNIMSLSKQEIYLHFQKNTALARRVYHNRHAFSVLFMSAIELQKCHIVDLKNKFEAKNFDITELRAYYSCLPPSFVADGGNEKAIWKDAVRKKLQMMLESFKKGALSKNKIRDPVYSNKQASKPVSASFRTRPPRRSLENASLFAAIRAKAEAAQKADSQSKNVVSSIGSSKKPPANQNLLAAIKARSERKKALGSSNASPRKPPMKPSFLDELKKRSKPAGTVPNTALSAKSIGIANGQAKQPFLAAIQARGKLIATKASEQGQLPEAKRKPVTSRPGELREVCAKENLQPMKRSEKLLQAANSPPKSIRSAVESTKSLTQQDRKPTPHSASAIGKGVDHSLLASIRAQVREKRDIIREETKQDVSDEEQTSPLSVSTSPIVPLPSQSLSHTGSEDFVIPPKKAPALVPVKDDKLPKHSLVKGIRTRANSIQRQVCPQTREEEKDFVPFVDDTTGDDLVDQMLAKMDE